MARRRCKARGCEGCKRQAWDAPRLSQARLCRADTPGEKPYLTRLGLSCNGIEQARRRHRTGFTQFARRFSKPASLARMSAAKWDAFLRRPPYVVYGCSRRGADSESHGGGRGPVAPPVFKTGLTGIASVGRFDSFPPPPHCFYG